MPNPPQTGPRNKDDQYKQATREIVDDNLRDDVLGPKICSVLANHTPESDKVRQLIAEAILKEPTCKEAIESVVNDMDVKIKSRWVDRVAGAVGGIIVAVLVGVIVYFVTRK